MIDKTFIDRVVELARPEMMEIDGRKYSTKPVFPVYDPSVASLGVHTLTGLVDFLVSHNADPQKIMIHVEDYNKVSVVSAIFGEHKQRESYLVATSYNNDHLFGQYVAVDSFIVYLLSMFVQDDTVANIMRIVGNITQGAEAQFADDGMTQRITAKAGVARVELVDLPNPVELRPFRTFADIEQQASKFLLRIKADKDNGPRCALFEADGGAWKNTAIATIRNWLKKETENSYQIIA